MAKPDRIEVYRLTAHALLEMARRGISESEVAWTLTEPDEVRSVSESRSIFQRLSVGETGKAYLDVDRYPAEVVAAYRTSKITKYGGS